MLIRLLSLKVQAAPEISTGTAKPAKMTYSIMTLMRRGLGDKRADANSGERSREAGQQSDVQRQQQQCLRRLGMGRCSSPWMLRKPKTNTRRKLACTRVGLEPTTHADCTCAPHSELAAAAEEAVAARQLEAPARPSMPAPAVLATFCRSCLYCVCCVCSSYATTH